MTRSRATLALLLGVLSLTAPPLAVAYADALRYSSRGVVRSFGPARAYVNIAHDAIPGYMPAMTMSFQPGRAGMLDGLDVQQRVAFTFTAAADGQRVLESIAKE